MTIFEPSKLPTVLGGKDGSVSLSCPSPVVVSVAPEPMLTSARVDVAAMSSPACSLVPAVTTTFPPASVMSRPATWVAGVETVEGSFGVGDCVRIDFQGKEFARGLVNYGESELNRIKGLHTSKIEKVLGYKAQDEVIHRDDLVIL